VIRLVDPELTFRPFPTAFTHLVSSSFAAFSVCEEPFPSAKMEETASEPAPEGRQIIAQRFNAGWARY
jgi:hypothetical protein